MASTISIRSRVKDFIVSASSTSGFAVPTDEIAKHFKLKNKDELSEGGKFFSKGYGTTHPGSAINNKG